jgi:hypothetical protein
MAKQKPFESYIPAFRSEVRLAYHEWKQLITNSIDYQIKKRVIDSQILGPAHSTLKTVEENVKQIASKGFAARVKLTRIIVRMTSAVLNNNRQALEKAVADLVELGKKVST